MTSLPLGGDANPSAALSRLSDNTASPSFRHVAFQRSVPATRRLGLFPRPAGGAFAGAAIVLAVILLGRLPLLGAAPKSPQGTAIVINGLGGLPEFEENFVEWAASLTRIFKARFGDAVHYLDGRTQTKEDILEVFQQVASENASEVWLVLVGHANRDGRGFRFHIRGPDLTGAEISAFLQQLGPQAKRFVLAGTSASGPLIPLLKGENRVIVTATKNENERQPPLFLSFFIEAASSAAADRDKNGRVSLLEAFLFSRSEVKKWFAARGLLQTEHPRLDDRGLSQISPGQEDEPDTLLSGEGWLSATAYLSNPPEVSYRSEREKRLAGERQEIEREIEALKFRKQTLPEPEYFRQLEALLVRLAETNEQIDGLKEE